ncbi:MAG TPA: DUF433 domain-containing protein, partial [Ktedonobacterales bacterium]|nr:DUF433 domain-containing protein [Ktedonobacterales bacterium]
PITALAALWREGASPETIQENYPSLSLAQVFGGLAYYLDHQAEIDAQLVADDAMFTQLQAEQQAQHPERVAEWKRRREAVRSRQATSES